MRQIILVVGISISLAGCASAPTFRNVVFEKVSDKAQVLNPVGDPRIGRLNNSFRFPPGSIVTASRAEFPNSFTRLAGLIPEVDNQCFQRVYRLNKLGPVGPDVPDVDVTYKIDASIGSQAALAQFRKDHRLEAIPDNVFAFIREASFHIDHIRVYEPTPGQLKISLEDAAKDCSSTRNVLGTLIIRKVYVGNVKSFVRWDDGVNVTFGKFKSMVQRSVRNSFDGRGIIFAVETDRL
jgi:hypothetical protein